MFGIRGPAGRILGISIDDYSMFFETFARSRQRYEDLIQIIACLSVRVFHVGYTPVRHTNANTYIGHDFAAKAKKEKAAILDEAADRAKTWEKGHCLLTSGMVSVETVMQIAVVCNSCVLLIRLLPILAPSTFLRQFRG